MTDGISKVLQPQTTIPAVEADPPLSKKAAARQRIDALAKQFNVSFGVASSLYRSITKQDPQASNAAVLAQFAQAVAKRTLGKADGTQQARGAGGVGAATGPSFPGFDTDTLTVGTSASQFLAAEPLSNSSNLSQQAYKQVTTNPQAGPVLPPPKPPAAGKQAPDLQFTVSKAPLLNPDHPNWQAFIALLMESMSDHADERQMWSQFEEQQLNNAQISSLKTVINDTEGQVYAERMDSAFGLLSGMYQAKTDYLNEIAGHLMSANPIGDLNSLDFTGASREKQHRGPFADLARQDAFRVMSGERKQKPGSKEFEGAQFFDGDAAYNYAKNLDPKSSRIKPEEMQKDAQIYRAASDPQSVQKRQERGENLDRIKNNQPLPAHFDFDQAILGQGRRTLTKAEISGLTPGEKRQHDHMMTQSYASRASDITDRVEMLQQEIGRLRSSAQDARDESMNLKNHPPGTDVDNYKATQTKMAAALDRKADALTEEHLTGAQAGKNMLQKVAFANRISMRTVMQHSEWLLGTKAQLETALAEEKKPGVSLENANTSTDFTRRQRLQVYEETLNAINRRIDNLYQSVKEYRGDAHQKGKKLQRNERLDKFKTAPGADFYNATWDAHEKLAAKANPTDADKAELTWLRASLHMSHDSAPAQEWEVWKLDRLHTKLQKLNRDPNATPAQVQSAKATLDAAIVTSKDRVDEKWLGALMDKHVKERYKLMTKSMHEKIMQEADPAKKADLMREESTLKADFDDRHKYWKDGFNLSRADKLAHHTTTAATAVGLGPKISYNLRNQKNSVPAPAKGARSDAEQVQMKNEGSAGVNDHDDAWLQGDDLRHAYPPIDYNNPEEVERWLKTSVESRGSSLTHWDDKAETVLGMGVKQTVTIADQIKSAFGVNQGALQNFAQEGADMAEELRDGVNGDFVAAYNQIQAMRQQLVQYMGKLKPWG